MPKIKRALLSFRRRMIKKQQIRKKIRSPMKKIIRRMQKGQRRNKSSKSPTIKSRGLLNQWPKESNSKR